MQQKHPGQQGQSWSCKVKRNPRVADSSKASPKPFNHQKRHQNSNTKNMKCAGIAYQSFCACGIGASPSFASSSSPCTSENMNSCWYSIKNWALRFTSTNKVYTFRMSCTSTSCAFLFMATKLETVIK